MIRQLKAFFWTTVLGGLGVLLPIVLFCFLAHWLYGFVTDLIQPLTDQTMQRSGFVEWFADILVIVGIISLCFAIGFFIRFRVGRFIHQRLEDDFLVRVPGYTIIKETVQQFVGNKKSPFSQVALVQVFGNDTLMTAFVTDQSNKELASVFVPTGPNPTSGNIYHLQWRYVHVVDVSVESAMRSIIACGAGSDKLIGAYQQQVPTAEVDASGRADEADGAGEQPAVT